MIENKEEVIKKCEELIRSFNPVTHSIDTHIQDQLTKKLKLSDDEKMFIQQVVYGWYRERRALESFSDNFFADNAAFVSRADKTMYIIFTYIAVYRLEDFGFNHFKALAGTQDPTKMFNLISYLFNTDNLWSCLRADWMKTYDLTYVEDELIAGIEAFIPEADKYMLELQEKAQGLAAAQAAKEQTLKEGKAGLGEVAKRSTTKAVSPKLTRPRPPRFPEPVQITQNVTVNEVPSNLDRISVAQLEEQRQKQLEVTRKKTAAQYNEKYQFQLSTTKGGRNIDDLREEMEEKQNRELQFDSSFVNEPPDFSKIPAKVRLNAASILREDALYKKQQAKDVELLKQYEWELRDCSEYYTWQKEMKDRDEVMKLRQVAMRREQAKASAEEAKEAMTRQREDNKAVADVLRQQAEAIKLQKELEDEIRVLQNQELASNVIAVRDTKPREAKKKVLEERLVAVKKLKEELEQKQREKETEDAIEEERRADRIRQLRALNTVHKKHIKVFDPTETAGTMVMDEMSYMEMKERLEMEKTRAATVVANKNQEILEAKEKKAHDLEEKAKGIMRAREVKAQATRAAMQRRKEQEKREAEEKEKARAAAAAALEDELRQKRQAKKQEQDALIAEAERVKRQQQYLGAAMGRVDETRAEQILLGQEREAKVIQSRIKEEAVKREKAYASDLTNRREAARKEKREKVALMAEKDMEVLRERRVAIGKMKDDYHRKKQMVKEGRKQHEKTHAVKVEHNLYAARITAESLAKSRAHKA
mmetsp:Transcript_5104/g.7816  ORF Transcript_5104/g.7816 Transcript_5104/m.7816 type:complete len:763 (-) Transcript_5104:200-2488(-)